MTGSNLRIPDAKITIENMDGQILKDFSQAGNSGVISSEQMRSIITKNSVESLPLEPANLFRWLAQFREGSVQRALWEAFLVMSFNQIVSNGRRSPSDLLIDEGEFEPDRMVPLFATFEITYDGDSRHCVKTRCGGQNGRTLLKRSEEFETMLDFVGKTMEIQHILVNDETSIETSRFYDEDALKRIMDFLDDYAWVYHDDYQERMPISRSTPLDGFMYMMYKYVDRDIVPRYIGIARREAGSEGVLNENIARIDNDSKRGRWGDGYSNHVGGLSLACFGSPDDRDSKTKYVNWMEALFEMDQESPVMVDGKPVLQQQLYIDVSPWLDHDVEQSEENMIRLASSLFGDEILNTVHTG